MKTRSLLSCTLFLKISLYFIVLLLFTSCVHQSAINYPKLTRVKIYKTAKQINRAITETNANLNIGIKVVSAVTGEVLYEKNTKNLFTPASNTKLFTAAAALHILGPYFRFKTELYADTTLESGVIYGNVYLKGAGDPDFTDQDLEELVKDLKLLGLNEIKGNLVVDNFEFDSDPFGPGWMWDEGPWWYFAPVDAMTINDNCVKVYVKPGKRVNDPPIVRIEPETDYVLINNQAITVENDLLQRNLEVERRWKTKENIIDITGTISMSANPEYYISSIENPALYAGTIFKEILPKIGIRFNGSVINDTIPNDAVLLAKHISNPLSESITNFLKASDNLTGELLVKKIGAVTDSTIGSWGNGLNAIKSFLNDKVGIDTTTLVLSDGSGVSRYNLVSADHIVQLLGWVYTNFQIYPEFLAALPIAGADGTLRKRMLLEDLKMRTRAKTGSLQGVSSLSGYVITADNELLAFAILINGFIGNNAQYRNLQDKIVSILTNFTRY